MIGREARADFQIGDDARIERFSQRHACIHASSLRDMRPERMTRCLADFSSAAACCTSSAGAAVVTAGVWQAASIGGNGSELRLLHLGSSDIDRALRRGSDQSRAGSLRARRLVTPADRPIWCNRE